MKKLNNRARVTEVDAVSNQLVTIFENESGLATDPFLSGIVADIKAGSLKLTDAIKETSAKSELEEVDKFRSNKLRAIRNILYGGKSMPIAETKNASEIVWNIFSKYGVKIIKENYASKSSLIESMLMDFSEPTIVSQINKITGLKESIEELREAENAFLNKRMEYTLTLSSSAEKETATELKAILLEKINRKLLVYLDAMRLKDAGMYEEFSRTVEQIVEQANSTIDRRSKKDKKVPPAVEPEKTK